MTRARCPALFLAGLLIAGLALDHWPARAQPTAATVSTPAGEITVLADQLEELAADNLLIAIGNVEITRGTARLTADRVEINRATGDTVAEGRAIFYDGDDRITGDRIEYNFKSGTGVVYHGDAHARPYYRVAGERMERIAENRYRVRRGLFTTCEDEPPTWAFRFGSADADLEELIYGTSASFWVKNVPLVPFIPFFAAALRRERQTGFLFPRFGSSSRKGLYYEQPFFWAISDSQDATITSNFYEDLGVGGSVEYRYMLSPTHRGSANVFYIHETRDQVSGQGHDENRGLFGLHHEWLGPQGLSFKADINHVTDDFVFREFGDNLRQVSAQRVESNIFLTKTWPNANLVGNLFWYQDLTTHRHAELNRLPDIRFDVPRQPLLELPGLLYELESSAVRFVRDVGSEGTRVDLHPRLSHPIPVFGFFTVTPFAGGRLTAYDKRVTGRVPSFDEAVIIEQTTDDVRLRRLIEVGSDLEARAIRIYQLGGFADLDAVLHSIEPRVNYTLINGWDMNHLPQWTAGIDDIRPTSTLTYSVVNRLRARTVAPEGTEPVRWELARFTLSNAYRFNADRGRTPEDRRPFGNVTGDLIVDPNRVLTFRADAGVNPYSGSLQTANTDLSVRLPARLDDPIDVSPLIAAVGTRYSRPDDVSFLQGSLTAEVTRWATARVTTNWDLRSNTFVENHYAVDLKWQCWAFTAELVTRVRDPQINTRSEEEFRFTLNLLGIGAPLSTRVGLGALTGAQAGGAVK